VDPLRDDRQGRRWSRSEEGGGTHAIGCETAGAEVRLRAGLRGAAPAQIVDDYSWSPL